MEERVKCEGDEGDKTVGRGGGVWIWGRKEREGPDERELYDEVRRGIEKDWRKESQI